MSKKMTQLALEVFNKKLQKIFDRFGVEKSKNMTYEFSLKTSFGTLLILPRNEAGGSCWSIFMRFDSDWKKDELLKKLPFYVHTLNPYSGKWNIHTTSSDEAIHEFLDRMEDIEQKEIA